MHTEVFDKILIHFAIQHYNGSLTLQMLFIIFIKTFRPGCRQIELPRTSGMVLQFSRVISYLPLSAVIFNTVANLLCDNINVLANQDHAYRLKSTSGGRGVQSYHLSVHGCYIGRQFASVLCHQSDNFLKWSKLSKATKLQEHGVSKSPLRRTL